MAATYEVHASLCELLLPGPLLARRTAAATAAAVTATVAAAAVRFPLLCARFRLVNIGKERKKEGNEKSRKAARGGGRRVTKSSHGQGEARRKSYLHCCLVCTAAR